MQTQLAKNVLSDLVRVCLCLVSYVCLLFESYVLSCFDGHKCVHNRGFPLFGWIYFASFLFPCYLICSHFVTNTYHHVANTPLSILRYAVFKTMV